MISALALFAGSAYAAQPPVGLGTAESFGVLAGTAVTNTGPSTIGGDLGLSPGTAITGFPPGKVNGTIHVADAAALQAQADLKTAYNDAAGRTPPVDVSGDLGGRTLTAGVYKSASSLGLTGALTLDGQGSADAVFIFQAGSTLTTASASSINFVNGAQACNVFWQIGSSATLGSGSGFAGNILALTSISVDDAVTVDGRLLARNGAVSLINDTITTARCAAATPTGPTPGTTPAPGSETTGAGATPGTVVSAPPTLSRGRCVDRRFRATVKGRFIKSVVFSVGTRTIATRRSSPFEALVGPGKGVFTLVARVTFADSTPAKTLRLRYRACEAAVRAVTPPRASPPPPRFTG